jgi:uridine kinase
LISQYFLLPEMNLMSKAYIIAISGGSGSGKSTFVKELVATCGVEHCCVLSLDEYYRDMSHLPKPERDAVNYDHPEQIDYALLVQQLGKLAEGKAVMIPQYDFASHSRKKDSRRVEPRQLIFCEGIFALYHEALRRLCDLKVFLDVRDELRLQRRITRDQRDRGRTAAQVRAQYTSTVRPMYEQYVAPTKLYADIVVNDSKSHDRVMKIIRGVASRCTSS